MANLNKYRQYSNFALIALIAFFFLSSGTLWNLITHNKNEGWVFVFLFLLFATSIFIYRIAYNTTNSAKMNELLQNSYESGKKKILAEIDKKKSEEEQQKDTKKVALENTVKLLLAGLKNIKTESGFCKKTLSILANEFGFVQGLIYIKDKKGNRYNPAGEYALTEKKPEPFKKGENLNGQVAADKSMMIIYDVPEDYFTIASGLGSSKPQFLIIIPLLANDESIGVIEFAAFKKPDETSQEILTKLSSELGNRLNKFVAA